MKMRISDGVTHRDVLALEFAVALLQKSPPLPVTGDDRRVDFMKGMCEDAFSLADAFSEQSYGGNKERRISNPKLLNDARFLLVKALERIDLDAGGRSPSEVATEIRDYLVANVP